MQDPSAKFKTYSWRQSHLLPLLQRYGNVVLQDYINASVNSACAQPPPPPGLLQGICPPCQSRRRGICKFCSARGPGICQPRGHSRAFDTHAVSYQNITAQRVLLEKKQIGSSVKDRNKLKRVVKACSRFYACISLLLIKPKLHSEIGAIDVNQRFLLLNQISVDII